MHAETCDKDEKRGIHALKFVLLFDLKRYHVVLLWPSPQRLLHRCKLNSIMLRAFNRSIIYSYYIDH